MRSADIIGAGIGGLAAALALLRRGCRVKVWERTPQPAPVGAGIVLAPNAVRALTGLGVDVASCGYPIRRFAIRDQRGRPLQTMDLTRLDSALAFHRAELHEAILRALPADLVRFDCAYPATHAFTGEVLVGADGIRSAVREHAVGPMRLRYSGYTCWRGICRNPGITEGIEDWGGAERIGVVPLTGGRVYVFLVLAAPPGLASMRPAFANFASPVPAVLEALSETTLLHHDIEEMDAPVWGCGKTVLIGDAAHAMTPNLGQGASMAIEDALVLPEIIDADDPASVMAQKRNARVAQIQKTSRRLGELAHWENSVAMSLRDMFIRCVPQWVGERNYRRLVEGGPRL